MSSKQLVAKEELVTMEISGIPPSRQIEGQQPTPSFANQFREDIIEFSQSIESLSEESVNNQDYLRQFAASAVKLFNSADKASQL